ncbi:hypothetical protein BX616_005723 [Lobosporangium transversale]|nr:hypothetical protein BX616_005723 [Lobosporangium transversale]
MCSKYNLLVTDLQIDDSLTAEERNVHFLKHLLLKTLKLIRTNQLQMVQILDLRLFMICAFHDLFPFYCLLRSLTKSELSERLEYLTEVELNQPAENGE